MEVKSFILSAEISSIQINITDIKNNMAKPIDKEDLKSVIELGIGLGRNVIN